jgi:hypothetical protein
MARAKASRGSTPAAVPQRRMGTSEARTEFTKLVRELSSLQDAARSLVENAIEVGPQRKGGVWLVPEVDGQAAVARIEELEDTIATLEDELENIAIGHMLAERVAGSGGGTTPAAEVIRELGFGDLAQGLPE